MTNIEWTDVSWNPIVGCSIVSPGCTNCYAMQQAARLLDKPGSHYHGTTTRVKGKPVWTGKVALAPDHILTAPLRWEKPRMVFVNSMGDLFHEGVPDEWIDKVFAIMALCPQHIFQVLTKRAKRMRNYILERWQATPARTIMVAGQPMNVRAGAETGRYERIYEIAEELNDPIYGLCNLCDPDNPDHWNAEENCIAMQFGWPLPNVWLGVSAEDQTRADERIPHLLATPAAVRFVACEIDWVIAGGESGRGARPMHPDWARSLRDQCKDAGVPFFFKQMDKKKPIPNDLMIREFPNA